MKLLFLPVSIGGGFLAGLVAKKAFEAIWGVVDDEDPPDAQYRRVDYRKLVVALVLEGAIFRLVRGLFDHASRQGFARVTGSWPGDEAPEPE